MKDKFKENSLYGEICTNAFIRLKSKEELLEAIVKKQSIILKQKQEIERLNNTIITLENERDVLKSKLSDIKADIHYLLENGESLYIRNKYI